MTLLITIRGMAETIMIYLFYWLITEQVSGATGRTLFFADFYIWLNISTLVLLAFGANRMINRFGLVTALASMPVALFLGTMYLMVQTIVLAVYILRITYSALEHSLYGQGIDRMILEVGEKHAQLVRPLLHGLAVRVGRATGAVFVLLLALVAGISFGQMTGFFVLVLAIWILIALSLLPFLKKPSVLAGSEQTIRSAKG